MKPLIATSIIALTLLAGCKLPGPFDVISLNVAADNTQLTSWKSRADDLANVIIADRPAVIGLQSLNADQCDRLISLLEEEYEIVYFGSEDGYREGDTTPILYDAKKLSLVQCGRFWLSHKPDTPGTVGWDATAPRIVTWVELSFQKSPLNRIIIANTLLDDGTQAQDESGHRLRLFAETIAGSPIIMLGDFNSGPRSSPHNALLCDNGNLAQLYDARAKMPTEMRRQPAGEVDHWHDWILHSRRLRTIDCRFLEIGSEQFPISTHQPLKATLELIPATRFGTL